MPQPSPLAKSGAPSRSPRGSPTSLEERDRYLQAVEHEVVELALAVAARILRREAQMDPLLLTGCGARGTGAAIEFDRGVAARSVAGIGSVDRGHGACAESLGETQGRCPATGCGWANARLRPNWDRSTWASAHSWVRSSAASLIELAEMVTRLPIRKAYKAAGSEVGNDRTAGPLSRQLASRAAVAMAGAGDRVGRPDHRILRAAGFSGRVLRDHGPVRPGASGRGDRLSRIECAVDAG